MKISIQPVDIYPTKANQLFVSDTWTTNLGSAPIFNYTLQNVLGKTIAGLKSDTVSMTFDQWQKWAANADDETYILACVATNLGLQTT